MIPERATIYDFCFEKKASGNWIEWMDTLDRSKLTIPKDAKVIHVSFFGIKFWSRNRNKYVYFFYILYL